MKIKNFNLCIACMHPLDKDGSCAYCHFQQEGYQPIPRCLRPGTELVGRYVLGKVLGEGSFGITYIAWDTLLDTAVAIKEYFPSSLASRHVGDGGDHNVYIYEKTEKRNYQDNLQKYLDEAKSLSAFSELDGIVSVRDFFYANLTAYIVMAYVEGVSMKAYVEENGRIEGDLFLEMLKPILYSLAKVHETGVLHRDISPDNILITKENKMVLIDFGAARKENISMTRSMTVVFKQGYSPEEQYRSHGKQGAWSDIYALCATAYYALTGKRPDEAIERVLEDEMQSLEDMPDIQLTDIQKRSFMKGIAVRPSERYQTVQELYEDLYVRQDEKKPGVILSYKKEMMVAVSLLLLLAAVGILQWRIRATWAAETMSGQEKQLSGTEKGSDSKKQINGAEGNSGISVDDGNTNGFDRTGTGGDKGSVGEVNDVTSTNAPILIMNSYEGLTRSEAEQQIENGEDPGLQVVWEEDYHDTVKKGIVMKQSIPADTRYQMGEYTQLILTVSKGIRKVTVPSVSGMSRKQAEKKLKNKKLKISVKQERSSQVDKGMVIRQSIGKGKKVKEGTKITITVSSGMPEPARTPKPESQTPRKTAKPKDNPDEDFAGVIP